MKPKRTVKHHTVKLNSVELIDWHLKHLWSDGWTTIKELTPKQHIQHHITTGWSTSIYATEQRKQLYLQAKREITKEHSHD
jgi:hypothetical protein